MNDAPIAPRITSRHSAFTCTGRSACRNVPIATSTATSAMRAIDEQRYLRAFHAEIAKRRRTVARPHRVLDLFRRRHAVPDAAGDDCRRAQFHRAAVACRARCRDHDRSQSDERRGRALSRLSHGRRQSRVARRAGARRSRACRTWAAAYGARGARCRRRRAHGVRPLFVRSDLHPAAASSRRNGRRSSRWHWPRRASTCRSTS